ncbi:MAG: 3'-5' exonuclease [Bacteroidota bacterium]|nr:3'-5' exonuclease [Bacteroidota bacterium]
MQQYIAQLNDAQRAPVLHKDGALIVIAGAGSGKTRVLTVRIANLMSQGIDAFNILALTFTNKAAREMKNRIGQIVGNSEAKNLWMGTFHSIFAKILRAEADKLGYPSNFTIYDTQDSIRLIGAIIKEMQLDKDIYKPKEVLNRISSYKNNLITVKAYFNNLELQEADAMRKRPRIGDIYRNYVERCFRAGAMDFDDLLLKTNELLNVYPEVLAKYQNRFRYILVDEYQDTNHSQYLIVKALSDRFQNICVVGDDAQSIYAFRGANINNILNFQKDYPNVVTYRLEQNYRSTANIVEAANTVIDKNQVKLEKNVWTANAKGEKITVHRSLTDAEEGRFVASTIFRQKMQKQLNNSDFAVLYRTNSQSRAIEDALRKKDIPYKIYGGLSFYQRKEIKDVLSYFRLVVNTKDEEALVRIINYPARGIGGTTLEKLSIAANHYKRSVFEVMENIDKIDLKLNTPTKQRIEDFVTMIKNFQVINQNNDAFFTADYITKKSGLFQELKKEATTPEDIVRLENVEELLNGIKDFVEGQQEIDQAKANLEEFIEDIALATDLDKEREDDDRVALMTIHLAKGLEFPEVFIVGLEENLFPNAKSVQSRTELEEERRLFYVALTRAEKKAYLSYCENRYKWGSLNDCEPSRFIEEIDQNYLHYDNQDFKGTSKVKTYVDPDVFESIIQKRMEMAQQNKQNVETNVPKNLNYQAEQTPIRRLKRINSTTNTPTVGTSKIKEGDLVMHERFGQGKVLSIEGVGADKKAEIQFDTSGTKKLLLRFAKLDILY